jgi:hypothetical protein
MQPDPRWYRCRTRHEANARETEKHIAHVEGSEMLGVTPTPSNVLLPWNYLGWRPQKCQIQGLCPRQQKRRSKNGGQIYLQGICIVEGHGEVTRLFARRILLQIPSQKKRPTWRIRRSTLSFGRICLF